MRAISLLALVALFPLAGCDSARSDDASGTEAATQGADAPPQTASSGAGDFEGVISAMVSDQGRSSPMKMWIKGSRMRIDMDMQGERGAIIRDGQGRMVTVMEESRQYMYLPDADGAQLPSQFTSTGRRETIAGLPCETYRVHNPGGIQDGDEVCITTALGYLGMGPKGSYPPDLERALRQQFRDGFLILQSRNARGEVEYEITQIDRTAVSDDKFVLPSGLNEIRLPEPPTGRR